VDGEIVVERRRQWTPEEKAALMAEVEAEGGQVSVVARRHGISKSLFESDSGYPDFLSCATREGRIAAECAFVDERGGVGIRLKPAAAIVRQYGEQFRRPHRRRQTRRAPKPLPLL
jgi:hypothetical protein